MPRTILFLAAFMAASVPTSAFAHMGHLGELAGHSHWIGLIAGAAAVSIAAALAVLGKKTEAQGESEPDTDAEEVEAS